MGEMFELPAVAAWGVVGGFAAMANPRRDHQWICHLVSLRRRRRANERTSTHEMGAEMRAVLACGGTCGA